MPSGIYSGRPRSPIQYSRRALLWLLNGGRVSLRNLNQKMSEWHCLARSLVSNPKSASKSSMDSSTLKPLLPIAPAIARDTTGQSLAVTVDLDKPFPATVAVH